MSGVANYNPKGRKKLCTECGKERSLSYFHKSVNTRDGLRYKCISCCTSENNEWRDGKERYEPQEEEVVKVVDCRRCGYSALGKDRLELHMKSAHRKRA